MSRHLKAIQIMLIIMGVLLLIPVLIPVMYMVTSLGIGKYAGEDCVKLPHGVYISRLPIFNGLVDASPFPAPVTLKDKNFNIIVPDRAHGYIDDFYMTATTLYGVINYSPANPNALSFTFRKFAYRSDTGLVLRVDNPQLYRTLIDEAGTLIDIVPPRYNKKYADLTSTYDHLRDLPQYQAKCPLNIFAF